MDANEAGAAPGVGVEPLLLKAETPAAVPGAAVGPKLKGDVRALPEGLPNALF